jgi:glycerol-3-phosphate O-acyltransferase
VPAPLDPDSLEMFWLMAKKAKRPTYFYPLALYTYSILPPPPQVEKELGEQRKVNYAPAYLSFGTAIDMQHFPGSEHENKVQRRLSRAHHINHLIQDNYKKLFEN